MYEKSTFLKCLYISLRINFSFQCLVCTPILYSWLCPLSKKVNKFELFIHLSYDFQPFLMIFNNVRQFSKNDHFQLKWWFSIAFNEFWQLLCLFRNFSQKKKKTEFQFLMHNLSRNNSKINNFQLLLAIICVVSQFWQKESKFQFLMHNLP